MKLGNMVLPYILPRKSFGVRSDRNFAGRCCSHITSARMYKWWSNGRILFDIDQR